MKSESGGKEIEKIEMMKKYLMIIIFTMGLSSTFAQIDSVEVKFQDYLTKVDNENSIAFKRIKKELELPTVQNSIEMLAYANSIDPNAKWKLVGCKVERWESLPIYELKELLLEVDSSKLNTPIKEKKPDNKRTDIYAPISESNSFNSEFLFDVFTINEKNDFRNENVTAIPQIHPFTSWEPYYYQDLLILKKQHEYIGQSTNRYKTVHYYFRKLK